MDERRPGRVTGVLGALVAVAGLIKAATVGCDLASSAVSDDVMALSDA